LLLAWSEHVSGFARAAVDGCTPPVLVFAGEVERGEGGRDPARKEEADTDLTTVEYEMAAVKLRGRIYHPPGQPQGVRTAQGS
jgi:hypothetical protein